MNAIFQTEAETMADLINHLGAAEELAKQQLTIENEDVRAAFRRAHASISDALYAVERNAKELAELERLYAGF